MKKMVNLFLYTLIAASLIGCLNPQLAELEEVEVIEANTNEAVETDLADESEDEVEELSPEITAKIEELGDVYLTVLEGFNGSFAFPPQAEVDFLDSTTSYCTNLSNNYGTNLADCDSTYLIQENQDQINYLQEYVYANYTRGHLDFPISGLSRYVELALITLVMDDGVDVINYQNAKFVEDGTYSCDSIGGLQESYLDNFQAPGDYRLFNQGYEYSKAERTEIVSAYNALSGADIAAIQSWANDQFYFPGNSVTNVCP